MTFNPTTIKRYNIDTEEEEISPHLVDQNLRLIGLETKKLQDQIISLQLDNSINKEITSRTDFRNLFLFG